MTNLLEGMMTLYIVFCSVGHLNTTFRFHHTESVYPVLLSTGLDLGLSLKSNHLETVLGLQSCGPLGLYSCTAGYGYFVS